nr:piriformospora indica-insensitive protein 2-like [Tanacetum cinerariifolium]
TMDEFLRLPNFQGCKVTAGALLPLRSARVTHLASSAEQLEDLPRKTGDMDTTEIPCQKVLDDKDKKKKKKAEANAATNAPDVDIQIQKGYDDNEGGLSGLRTQPRPVHHLDQRLKSVKKHARNTVVPDAEAIGKHSASFEALTKEHAILVYAHESCKDMKQQENALLCFEALMEEHANLVYAHESCKDMKVCYKESKKELASLQSAFDEKVYAYGLLSKDYDVVLTRKKGWQERVEELEKEKAKTEEPSLNSVEQEALYRVLDSLNSNIPWRTLFPDDLCTSAPHGVVCGYTTDPGPDPVSEPGTVNIIELNFGWVSDHNPNPPCDPNSTLPDPFIFASFPYLRKLFFYKCFTHRPISLNGFLRNGSGLEELVLVQNPSIYGSLTLVKGENLKGLRRLVITGSNVSGEIPSGFGELSNIEEVTLSRNHLAGKLPENLSNLKKVKVVDFSQNGLEGNIPANIGNLKSLEKLDLSFNKFSGNVPMEFEKLGKLNELNLMNNSLSGMLPFSAKFVTRVGRKLKVQGNDELCVDERVIWSFAKVNWSLGKLKVCKRVQNPISALLHVSSGSSSIGHQVSYLVVDLKTSGLSVPWC